MMRANSLPALDKTRGFSLVELSIVLVILGLLVGGVLSGKSLIHAAELRSIATDIGNFDAAVNSFRSKYFQYPGDMNNAASFWPTTCLDDGATQKCNGDGNGKIDAATGNNYENMRFWQHLSLAGLIPGSYAGVNTSIGNFFANPALYAKDFLPASRIANAYFIPEWDLTGANFAPSRTINVTAYLMTVGFITDMNDGTGAVLLPEDAYNLDVKSDDGKPLTGALQGNNGLDLGFAPVSPDCINGTAYRLDSSTIACSLIYRH